MHCDGTTVPIFLGHSNAIAQPLSQSSRHPRWDAGWVVWDGHSRFGQEPKSWGAVDLWSWRAGSWWAVAEAASAPIVFRTSFLCCIYCQVAVIIAFAGPPFPFLRLRKSSDHRGKNDGGEIHFGKVICGIVLMSNQAVPPCYLARAQKEEAAVRQPAIQPASQQVNSMLILL